MKVIRSIPAVQIKEEDFIHQILNLQFNYLVLLVASVVVLLLLVFSIKEIVTLQDELVRVRSVCGSIP